MIQAKHLAPGVSKEALRSDNARLREALAWILTEPENATRIARSALDAQLDVPLVIPSPRPGEVLAELLRIPYVG